VRADDQYEGVSKDVAFFETFEDNDWNSRWTIINDEKYKGSWEVSKGKQDLGFRGEKGLILKDAWKHSAIVAPLKKELAPVDVPLIIQFVLQS